MSQPQHAQNIVPCQCGSHEPYWHGPIEGLREYCCDKCWEKMQQAEQALDAALAEIEAVWKGIENAYAIEPRSLITEESKTNGFKYPLAQAIHTIWKREPQVSALTQALKDYGGHKVTCAKIQLTATTPPDCTCGFDAVLTGAQATV